MKKIFSIAVLLFASVALFGQCRQYTKKQCMPNLLPFLHNGQINNLTMYPGETAKLKMTFFAGQDYRMLVCSHDVIGDSVYYRVKTEKDQLVYSNQHSSQDHWDFNVATTQNLIIEVVVPEGDDSHNDLAHSGCVAVVVGFKQD